MAVKTSGLPVAAKPLTVPPTAVMSAAVKPVGASLKVKVTADTLSATLSAASIMFTTNVGAVVSTV